MYMDYPFNQMNDDMPEPPAEFQRGDMLRVSLRGCVYDVTYLYEYAGLLAVRADMPIFGQVTHGGGAMNCEGLVCRHHIIVNMSR